MMTSKVKKSDNARNLKLVRPEAPVQRRKLLVNEDGSLVADFDSSQTTTPKPTKTSRSG